MRYHDHLFLAILMKFMSVIIFSKHLAKNFERILNLSLNFFSFNMGQ